MGLHGWASRRDHGALHDRQRLYVRNGFSYATHLTTSHQRIRRAIPKLRRAFENRFPEIKHVNFEFIYGGMINMTMNFRPLMTQKHPSVYASASGEGAASPRLA